MEMACYDVNDGDVSGRSPLIWAAQNGHEEVVKMLPGRRGSAITNQIIAVKHRSQWPLGGDVRERGKYYSDGKRSPQTS